MKKKKVGEQIVKEDLYSLSEEELRKISLEKTKIGNATKRALEAQYILWERAGFPFSGKEVNRHDVNFEDDDYGFGNRATDLYDKNIDSANDRKNR